MRKSGWTEKELKFLVKHWHKISNVEIGKKLGRSESSVRQKAEKYITIEMRKKIRWSKMEDDLLMKLYGTMTLEELSSRMKRSEYSIKKRAWQLEGTCDYTALQNVYTTTEIAGFLGIYDTTLRNRMKSIDMPFYKIKNKNLMNHDDFWNWLKDNLDQPNYRTIKDEYLLLSPDWYKEVIVRKKRELSKNNKGKVWNSKDEAVVWCEMLKGTSHKEIADMLQRSVYSIGHKIKELSKRKMSKAS